MPEEVTTPVETQTSEESYINPDGTYREGWKEALLPEELRNEQFYDSPFNTDVKELLKTAGNQAKALGKKGVIPITEKSSDFEIREYRKATGVPDTYVYNKPELEMFEIPDDYINRTLESFNKANMTQKQVDLAMNSFHEFWKATEDEYKKKEEEIVRKANQEILEEENTAYEENSRYIDTAVNTFAQGWSEDDIKTLFSPTDYKEGMNSKDHIALKKLMRRFLTNVGKGVGGGRMIQGETSGKPLQEQLDEVMKSEEYLKGFGKVHTDAVNKALKLREKLNELQGK